MHIEDVLVDMRSGRTQSPEAIAFFVRGVTSGAISRPQAAAWLAWAFARGLTDVETVALTREMTASGHVMRWPEGPLLVDKHSTGGVGDKVSLVLAPLWAELGLRVPMISGRGLGHTGGTLDKLEAIPGWRCDLGEEQLREQLDAVGCFINGQTARLAPADRVLYALRNETSTVESIPLITGSILSKKLAEGVQRLVLDVKTGCGAFMKSFDESLRLAETLFRVATGAGVDCVAYITAMDRPLGRTVGNASEVAESVECLKGGGPADLREITLALAGDPRAAEALDSGRALERFVRMIEAQGGDASFVDDPSRLLGAGTTEEVVRSDRTGTVHAFEAIDVGRAAFKLGAGRRRAEDPVDHGVGIDVLVKPGDPVSAGDAVAVVHHRDGHALGDALALLRGALSVGDGPAVVPPLIHRVIGG